MFMLYFGCIKTAPTRTKPSSRITFAHSEWAGGPGGSSRHRKPIILFSVFFCTNCFFFFFSQMSYGSMILMATAHISFMINARFDGACPLGNFILTWCASHKYWHQIYWAVTLTSSGKTNLSLPANSSVRLHYIFIICYLFVCKSTVAHA